MPETFLTDTNVPPLVGTLPPHCQRDVDTLRRFVREAISEGSLADPVSPADFQEVLLTGATGFVGRFLLRDLLRQREGLTAHCLVRANNEEHGFQRLRAALQHAEIWDEAFAPRIRVVVGDMEQARFGLGDADFSDLCRRIDAVYHFAADISLAASYVAIRKRNTLSLRNALELCLRGRFKHLFFASTMGVFPQYFFAFANEFRHRGIAHQAQPDLASMKRRFPLGLLGYPWSKLASEQVLLFARQAGLPLGIFRLPQTAMATTGYIQPNDLTMRILAAALDCESIPEGFALRSSHEAVDTVTQACAAISLNPERRFAIYHCCNPQLDPYDLELADFGIYFPEISYESFRRACQARGERSPLDGRWAALDHFRKYWFSKNKPEGKRPVCDRAFHEDCPHPIKWLGTLPKLRRSYEWGQAYRARWPYPASHGRLDFDGLVARAARYAEGHGVSFEQTYPAWMRQNLRQLVQALQRPEADLLEDRLVDVVFDLSRSLRINAAFARERQRYPEIEREEIVRPVFIVGINRTGTTYLHRLMARDERFQTLRFYEYAAPSLSREEYAAIGRTPDDPRRARVEELFYSSRAVEVFKGIHDFNIDEPAEDFPILSRTFGDWIATNRYHIPEFGRWLSAGSSREAYAFHRCAMQHYAWQRRQRPPERPAQWLFKMPFHLMELEALVETYPDALFIQTHRSPAEFMGSWCSLTKRIRSVFASPPQRDALGAEQLTFMSGMMDRAVHFRETHPELEERWADVNYVDLVENPLGTVRSVYERFGWSLRQAAIGAMEDWGRRQAERRRREKRHRYAIEEYGLTPEATLAAFARYREFITKKGIRTPGEAFRTQ